MTEHTDEESNVRYVGSKLGVPFSVVPFGGMARLHEAGLAAEPGVAAGAWPGQLPEEAALAVTVYEALAKGAGTLVAGVTVGKVMRSLAPLLRSQRALAASLALADRDVWEARAAELACEVARLQAETGDVRAVRANLTRVQAELDGIRAGLALRVLRLDPDAVPAFEQAWIETGGANAAELVAGVETVHGMPLPMFVDSVEALAARVPELLDDPIPAPARSVLLDLLALGRVGPEPGGGGHRDMAA